MRPNGLQVLLGGLLVMFANMAGAVTCTSTQDGNWSAKASWDCGTGSNNGPPKPGDAVVISNYSITLDTSATVLSLTVDSLPARLQHTSATNYTLTVNGAVDVTGAIFSSGGTGVLSLTAANVTSSGIVEAGVMIVSGALVNSGIMEIGTGIVNGNVTNTSAGDLSAKQFSFQGGAQAATFQGVTAFGDLTVAASSTVASTVTSSFTLTGNLVNNGSFSLTGATMTVSGTGAQTLGGANPVRIARLIVNKSAGTTTLSGDLQTVTALTLTRGVVTTGNYTLSLDARCGTGVTRGAGGWVDGNLQLTALTTAATCFFPIGDADNYAPLNVTYPLNSLPLGGKLTARTRTGDHPDTSLGLSGLQADKSVNRYWTLSAPSGTTFSSYSAKFQYCAAVGTDCATSDVDAAATPSNFVAGATSGGAWTYFTPSATTANTLSIAGASGFGDFAIGERGTSPTCLTDTFSGALDTTLWNVAGTGFTPTVVGSPTVPSSRLRLTDNGTYRATFAQVKRWFPAANNRVVVEFDYYSYGGTGGDGIAMVLSDAGVTPTPGAAGGSLGYVGFGGGWLGIGLDSWGNYPNATEGRSGYPAGYAPPSGAAVAGGLYPNSVAVRGSAPGYALLANAGTLLPTLTTALSTSHRYRLIFDNTNGTNAYVSLERNTGSGYVTLIPSFDARKANSGQASPPTNFLLSFTGSTGASTDFHEISNLRICATKIDPVGTTVRAAGFECVESGTVSPWSGAIRHPLYTKLTDTAFGFDVVALKSDGKVESGFVGASDSPKSVTVQLFDDSASPAPACSAYANPVASTTLSFSAADAGRKSLGTPFNLAKAYRKLRCRVSDSTASPTVYGCSTDTFAVRPTAFNSVAASASADSTGASATATPAIKAGSAFTLTAGTGKVGYDGTPQIDASKTEWTGAPAGGVTSPGVGVLGGVFTQAAVSATGNGASGSAFTYSEVGYFRFKAQGVYDNTFTASSGDIDNNDCTKDFSNTLVGGKYGCYFGNTTTTNHFGRFIPAHFAVASSAFASACHVGSDPGYSYMGQPFATALSATIEARNASGTLTKNYSGAFATGTVSVHLENGGNGQALPVARLNTTGGSWSGGRYVYTADRFQRLGTGPDGPYDSLDIGLAVEAETGLAAASRPYLITRDMDAGTTTCTTDLTGLSTAAGVCLATRVVTGTRVRYGRLWMGNAYGSERYPASVPYATQYWNGLAFVRNTLDQCTALTKANFGLANYQNAVTPSTLPVSWVSVGTFASGAGTVQLVNPDASGSVAVVARLDNPLSICPTGWTATYPSGTPLAAPWLRGAWCGTGDKDPVARATFGIAPAKRQIYLRESYQ